nr:MAG: ORF1 [TTV-like mini virus]
MPYYQRRWRWRRRGPTRRRRFPTYRRRFRRTLWRKRRRQPVRRRRYKYKKLRYLRLKEWQPKTIKKCRIKGQICLFQCGKNRIFNNYAQYQESIVPVHESGGGGWSALAFSLGALYTEHEHLRNWWTQGNKGLPLARYLGCRFRFYKSLDTDYVVNVQLCPPFTDTEYLHLNAQPSRALMAHRPIIVPNITRPPYNRKPYITKTFRPPSQFLNKWYFQQDICNTPVIMLITTAVSLDQYYLPNNELSNNITLYSLDTILFQNPNFQITTGTAGYQPKTNTFLYGTKNGHLSQDISKWTELIYLGNTQPYQEGQFISTTNIDNKQTWGNPFHATFVHADTRVFYSSKKPTNSDITSNQKPQISEVHEIYVECRYNPHKDTGQGNEMYLLSNTRSINTTHDAPQNPDLIITGFPLWLMVWGWTDWIKKLKVAQQIDINYYLVIKSSFIQPPRPCYIFLDKFFVYPHIEDMTETDKSHWYPKLDYQQESINLIAQSGPGAPKLNKSQSMQAKANYSFHFKWGGCPAKMQDVKDPCAQGTYPIPRKEFSTDEIEDPSTPKETHLYSFDESGGYLTKKCTKRLKTDFETIDFTGKKLDPPPQIQESENSSTEEETEKTPTKQRKLNRQLHHRLKRILRRLK